MFLYQYWAGLYMWITELDIIYLTEKLPVFHRREGRIYIGVTSLRKHCKFTMEQESKAKNNQWTREHEIGWKGT